MADFFSLDSMSGNTSFDDMTFVNSAYYQISTTQMIICLLVSIFLLVAIWKIFDKAGKPGWAAIIPIYNIVVLFQVVGLSSWLVLLLLVPFLGWGALAIILIGANFKLAKVFGKGTGFGFGLLLLGIIFYPMLAFDSSTYIKPNNN